MVVDIFNISIIFGILMHQVLYQELCLIYLILFKTNFLRCNLNTIKCTHLKHKI